MGQDIKMGKDYNKVYRVMTSIHITEVLLLNSHIIPYTFCFRYLHSKKHGLHAYFVVSSALSWTRVITKISYTTVI